MEKIDDLKVQAYDLIEKIEIQNMILQNLREQLTKVNGGIFSIIQKDNTKEQQPVSAKVKAKK